MFHFLIGATSFFWHVPKSVSAPGWFSNGVLSSVKYQGNTKQLYGVRPPNCRPAGACRGQGVKQPKKYLACPGCRSIMTPGITWGRCRPNAARLRHENLDCHCI